jgi:lipid A 3-O-deacylase
MTALCLLLAAALTLAPVAAGAQSYISEDEKSTLNLVVENDLFARTDQGYTSGVRLAWLSPESSAPPWMQWPAAHLLPLSLEGRKRIGVAAGHSIFTPSNLARVGPQPNDRPYAGWLYTTVGVLSDTGKTLDNLMLTVGVVGPLARGEHAQKLVHRITGSPHPRGWSNQLKNEPGLALSFERKWRALYEFSPFGFGADITPHAGASLGNVHTDATLGATLRLGYDLQEDYGPPRIRPSLPGSDFFIPTRQLSGYLFAGLAGRAVARDIFLDGNTFRDSPSVDKRPFVGNLQVGAAFTAGEARLSYSHVFATREFEGQRRPAQFGVLTLSHRF